MSRSKWAQRLRDFQSNPQRGTPKTTETPLLGVLGGGVEGAPGKNEGQKCDACRHMTRDRACLEPAAAGLADKGLPIWCDLMGGHGRTCPAFSPITKDCP